jgi:hypothetical protein
MDNPKREFQSMRFISFIDVRLKRAEEVTLTVL